MKKISLNLCFFHFAVIHSLVRLKRTISIERDTETIIWNRNSYREFSFFFFDSINHLKINLGCRVFVIFVADIYRDYFRGLEKIIIIIIIAAMH